MQTENKKYDLLFLLIKLIFSVTVIFWFIFIIYTKHTGLYEGPIFQYVLKPFLIGMTLLPLLGGLLGFRKSISWGGWKSTVGKTLISLSLGLICWSIGMIIWNYYLFFTNLEVPYPSLADLFFIMIWPLWIYSMYHLSKVTGIKYSLRSVAGKMTSILVIILVLIISYILLFKIARGGVIDFSEQGLALLLTILYPLGDIIILLFASLVFILSYKILGGRFKLPILILLFGFILNYIADFVFVYTTTVETYFNGHFSDFLYVLMIFVLTTGISMFDPNRLIDNTKKDITPLENNL